jgi:hypothetical protein
MRASGASLPASPFLRRAAPRHAPLTKSSRPGSGSQIQTTSPRITRNSHGQDDATPIGETEGG